MSDDTQCVREAVGPQLPEELGQSEVVQVQVCAGGRAQRAYDRCTGQTTGTADGIFVCTSMEVCVYNGRQQGVRGGRGRGGRTCARQANLTFQDGGRQREKNSKGSEFSVTKIKGSAWPPSDHWHG